MLSDKLIKAHLYDIVHKFKLNTPYAWLRLLFHLQASLSTRNLEQNDIREFPKQY